MVAPAELTWNEALSGVFGSVSLAAWIFLLVPQLIENYRLSSASGISLLFLSVWFVGDITNLLGATWAGLVPTVIALAVYFCLADFVLISQCLYYNVLNRRRAAAAAARSQSASEVVVAPSEQDALLGGLSHQSSEVSSQASTIGLPGSHRRRRSSGSTLTRQETSGLLSSAMERILEEQDGEESRESWLRNTISVLLVCGVGAAGWLIAWRSGVWVPAPGESDGKGDVQGEDMAVGAQILGYISAVCYLGARIPQIIKNQKEKSCEGLSLLFFVLSLVGNATYGAGILFHSIEKAYVLKNLPWLIGSIGTMAEDAIIFVQFHTFRVPRTRQRAMSDGLP